MIRGTNWRGDKCFIGFGSHYGFDFLSRDWKEERDPKVMHALVGPGSTVAPHRAAQQQMWFLHLLQGNLTCSLRDISQL
jgi:hypothetical protein